MEIMPITDTDTVGVGAPHHGGMVPALIRSDAMVYSIERVSAEGT